MKAKLRKLLRAERRSMGAADHAHRSRLAAKALTPLSAFRAGKRIALYLPFDCETDTAALIAAARAAQLLAQLSLQLIVIQHEMEMALPACAVLDRCSRPEQQVGLTADT